MSSTTNEKTIVFTLKKVLQFATDIIQYFQHSQWDNTIKESKSKHMKKINEKGTICDHWSQNQLQKYAQSCQDIQV